jgi:hypothetical protein
MKKQNLILILTITVFALTACEKQRQGVSKYPMILEDLGSGPWQIVTYEDEKVFHETIALDGRSVAVRSESVYISNKSQFIYRDGTPITTYDGKYLYWNKDGLVINRLIEVIPEDQVFVVNGKPMQVMTAMKLRDYHKPAPMVTLVDIGRAE